MNKIANYTKMMHEKDVLKSELDILVAHSNSVLNEINPNTDIFFRVICCKKKEAKFDVFLVKKEIEKYLNITSLEDKNRKLDYVKGREYLNFILR